MNAVEMKMEHIVNGVNVGDLEQVIGNIAEDATMAEARFRVMNKWVRGGHNQSRVRSFYSGGQDHDHEHEFAIDADEPAELAGTDIGANPAEYMLSALAACLTTTLVYHAAVRGIEIRALEAEVEGDLDLRGLFGMSDEVRQGFDGVRVRYRIDTDAENLETIRDLVQFSPVYDVMRNGTNVAVSIMRI